MVSFIDLPFRMAVLCRSTSEHRECDKEDLFLRREYFRLKPVDEDSRITRQLSEMDWSVAHER